MGVVPRRRPGISRRRSHVADHESGDHSVGVSVRGWSKKRGGAAFRPAAGGMTMASGSPIEWTESTWNPVTGCTKISPGCKHCYAERMAERLRAMGQANYRNGFELTLQQQMLELPLRWKKPQRIFVNSMSDLFHRDVPADYVRRVFDVMGRAHWHQFQI